MKNKITSAEYQQLSNAAKSNYTRFSGSEEVSYILTDLSESNAPERGKHCVNCDKNQWQVYSEYNHPKNHDSVKLVILDTGEYDIAYWDDTLEWMIDGNSHQKVEKWKEIN